MAARAAPMIRVRFIYGERNSVVWTEASCGRRRMVSTLYRDSVPQAQEGAGGCRAAEICSMPPIGEGKEARRAGRAAERILSRRRLRRAPQGAFRRALTCSRSLSRRHSLPNAGACRLGFAPLGNAFFCKHCLIRPPYTSTQKTVRARTPPVCNVNRTLRFTHVRSHS